MRYSIVIPVYNNKEDTIECIETLIKYTDFSKNDIEAIIVSNGSNDGVNEYLMQLGSEFRKMFFPSPLGYPKAVNIGIQHSRGEYIILLNNDVVFLEQRKNTWIEMLEEPFLKDSTVGVTGPLKSPITATREKEAIIFFCAMFKKALYDAIGPLDETFSPGSGEDYDFCIKAMNLGYKLVQVPDDDTFDSSERKIIIGNFPIFHKAEKTVHKYVPEWKNILRRNSKILTERYNCKILLGDLTDFEDVVDDSIELIQEELSVTAYISTKNRYFTTLPIAISGILNQTFLPKEFVLFDDGDKPDLRENGLYQNLFSLFDAKGIEWKVLYGSGKGQVFNHDAILNIAKTPFIWRIDDDDLPEPKVLETLISTVKKNRNVGAIGCLVINPKTNPKKLNSLASNKIEDIYLGLNIQWYHHDDKKIIPVDHIYNSFLINVEAGLNCGGYFTDLSPACHREETIFTYRLKRAGYDVLVDNSVVIWHLMESSGGIRSYVANPEFWEYDEDQFTKLLKEWNIIPKKYKFVVLENGRGDHFAFKEILPEVKEKYKDHIIVLATCYPEIFEDDDEIIQISIAEAVDIFKDITNFNIYKFMIDVGWKGKLSDAYRKLYL